MLCCHCQKNQAAKTYERMKNGEKDSKYYCLDCYERLFLGVEEAEGDELLSACPYCGTTKAEIEKSKLVGCGYCYTTLGYVVLPMVLSMQGAEIHQGKQPPLSEEDGYENYEQAACTDAKALQECEAEIRKQARFQRQCHELETVIGKLIAERDFQGAKEYEEKLKRMKEKSEVEEEFVWRRQNTSGIPKKT